MTRKHHQSISRTSSRERSVSPHRGDNLFSDENAIEDFGVADGFQPTFNLQNMSSTSQRETHNSSNSLRTSSPPRESKRKQSRTQETVAPLISRNSFSLRHDAQYSDAPRRIPSISSTTGPNENTLARPSSLLSRQSTYVRPQSTYAGPSAPSHPYGMYPQNSTEMAHRASVASSHRPTRERSYHGRDRPTHPYAMYPQDVAPEAETTPLGSSTDIASVGFPGLAHQYARRLGPDGEEADDIIGPDGHTEQLPPYTRYPDIPSASSKRETRAAAAPLSPIPQEPSFIANSATSMSDTLLSPTAYNATRVEADGNSTIPAKKTWREKSKRPTCCGRLPLWAVVFIVILLIVLSAALGGLIGHLLAKAKSNGSRGSSGSPEYSATMSSTTSTAAADGTTPTFGAIPLPTTYTAPVTAPTGDYDLLISNPNDSSASCLQSSQQVAWDCIGGSTVMDFSVQNSWYGPATVELIGDPPDPDTHPLLYGDQYPAVSGNISASKHLDPDDQGSGATLYFHANYDKQVLVPFQKIGNSAAKRSIGMSDILEGRQLYPRSAPKVQDQALLWNCIWPNTDMDGFIYVNVSTRPDIDTTSSSTTPSPTPTSASKRGISRVAKGQTPTNLYPRKVKLVEYRDSGGAPPSCTLMQYCNGALATPTQPPANIPTVLPLQEIKGPPQKSMYKSYWRRGASNHRARDADADGVCFCEWIIT